MISNPTFLRRFSENKKVLCEKNENENEKEDETRMKENRSCEEKLFSKDLAVLDKDFDQRFVCQLNLLYLKSFYLKPL